LTAVDGSRIKHPGQVDVKTPQAKGHSTALWEWTPTAPLAPPTKLPH